MTIRTAHDFAGWAADHLGGLTYVGPDPHYGIGLEPLIPGLRFACSDRAPAVRLLRERGIDVWVPDDPSTGTPVDPDTGSGVGVADIDADADKDPEAGSKLARSASALLAAPQVQSFVARRPTPRILVFKSSHAMEERCRELGWQLLAGPARVARRWENKVAFRGLADRLGLRQPPGWVVATEALDYRALAAELGPRLVLQSAHGYAGNRTAFVDGPEAMTRARAVLRGRRVRVTSMMGGVPWTLNACVTARGTAVGAPFRQITGLDALTPYALGSCGQDWTWGIDDDAPLVDLARRAGGALRDEGYRGLLGVDFVVGDDGVPYMIEVNPRLVASIAAYTQLEMAAGGLPLLARHILAHVAPKMDDAPLDLHLDPVTGSQLVFHHIGQSAAVAPSLATGGWMLDPTGQGPDSVGSAGEPSREPRFEVPALRVDGLPKPLDLVLAPEPNRRLGPGDSWLRVQRRRRSVDGSGHLLPDVVRWVSWFQDRLR